jgi:hypothetical protein
MHGKTQKPNALLISKGALGEQHPNGKLNVGMRWHHVSVSRDAGSSLITAWQVVQYTISASQSNFH